MIHPTDYPILRAFLHRESKMFQWELSGEKGRQAFVRRMFKTLVKESVKVKYPGEKFDFIRIQSISNVGLLESELVLTASPWGPNKVLIAMLPPTPRGGISFAVSGKNLSCR